MAATLFSKPKNVLLLPLQLYHNDVVAVAVLDKNAAV